MKLRTIKVSDEDWEEWKRKATASDKSLSEWIRGRCNDDRPVSKQVSYDMSKAVPTYLLHDAKCICGVCAFARQAGLKK